MLGMTKMPDIISSMLAEEAITKHQESERLRIG